MKLARVAAATLVVLATFATGVGASGMEALGVGASGTGMGGAFRAVADDWSAAYYNPAGYARLMDNQVGGGVAFLHHRNEIIPNFRWGGEFESGMLNDQSVYNLHEIANNPSGGFVLRTPYWGETVVGFSAYQAFDYSLDWALYDQMRAYNSLIAPNEHQFKNNFEVVAFQLTAAREFKEDKLALGLGLQVLRANLVHRNLYFRDNPYLQIDPDWAYADRPNDKILQATKEDGFGFGFGFNGGLMWTPSEKLSVGVSASVPLEIAVDGQMTSDYFMPEVSRWELESDDPGSVEMLLKSGSKVVDTAEFEAKLTLPPSFGAGLAYQLTEKLLVAVDAKYTLWSQFDGYNFTYSAHTLTSEASFRQVAMQDEMMLEFFTEDMSRPVDWKDALTAALGLRYRLNNTLTLMAGGNMDQSPASDNEIFTPEFTDLGDKYTINGGFTLHLDQWELMMVTGYTQHPDATTTQLVDLDGDGIVDSFAGDYSAESYQTVLSFNYRF